MIRVGIVGATGYGGNELVRLLLNHPQVKISWVSSQTYAGNKYSDIYPTYFQLLDQDLIAEDLIAYLEEIDLVFFATPQGVCARMINDQVLAKVKVIDLSADFRIKDVETYEAWYQIHHPSPEFIKEAVYGLCEINRQQIKQARLVANPGCYPTCSALAILPLLNNELIEPDSIIIDAKSGTSGAGRAAKVNNLFCEVNESIKAYGVAGHRHIPEIEEQLSLGAKTEVRISFTPHLVPMNRGILVTAYGKLKAGVTEAEIQKAYQVYQDECFIRVRNNGQPVETRNVRGSNFVDISYKIDQRTGRIIIMGAIDNLVKGAAGQAIQNMNLLFGLDEKSGLELAPLSL